jgi:hypothetical protein
MAKKVYYTGNDPWLRSFDHFEQDEMGAYSGVFMDQTNESGSSSEAEKAPRRVDLESRFSRDVQLHHTESEAQYDLHALSYELSSEQILEILMRHVNIMGNEAKLCSAVKKVIPQEHRTLQQNFGRFLRVSILTFASMDYDDRNAGAVQMCRAMKEIAEKAHLPFI